MNFKLLSIILISTIFITSCKSSSVTKTVTWNTIADMNWEMQEIRFLQQNSPYYYNKTERSGNNMNFDNDYIRFNLDQTGIYHQMDGQEYQIKWKFTNQQNTGIEYTIDLFRNGQPLIVHWDQVQLNGKTLKYSEFYTHANGTHSLAYAVRTIK